MLKRAMLTALFLGGTTMWSQQPDMVPRTPQDTLIQRARRLFEAGNAVDGRKLVDSVLSTTTPEDPSYAEALYWRAATATAAVDAERDYRRLLVEAPLSARAEDGMLQLAQLEQARGDRRAASDHLQRFLLSYPNNPARPRVAVSLVRLLFEQGQVARGCEALRRGREVVPPNNLELHNQLEFYAPRCVVLETAPPAPPETPARSDTARAPARPPQPSAPAEPTTPKPPAVAAPRPATAPASTAKAGSSFYSVQVAAFDAPESASRLAASLVSRGLEARVDRNEPWYRVRVGKYATRAEAVQAAATLKGQGITGFVTLVSP